MPQDGLVGKVGVPIVTGHGVAHSLAVDHGLRPLFASIGATVVAHGVYATSEQFSNGTPAAELRAAVDRAVREAAALASAASDRGNVTSEREHRPPHRDLPQQP